MKKILLALLLSCGILSATTLDVYYTRTTKIVTLEWDDNSDDEVGFEVQVLFTRPRYKSPQDWTTVDILPADTTTTSFSPPRKGDYYFRVRALGTSTFSDWSNIVIIRAL